MQSSLTKGRGLLHLKSQDTKAGGAVMRGILIPPTERGDFSPSTSSHSETSPKPGAVAPVLGTRAAAFV